MKVLFVSGEAHPLVKTGGLGDVSGALPVALEAQRNSVRLVIPAYRSALAKAGDVKEVARLDLPGAPAPVRILEGRLPGHKLPLWLVDSPSHFDRDGGPYQAPDGGDWGDNPERFTLFARAVVELACDRAGLGWAAEVVHCNDWQTGLVPPLLSLESPRPATLFTIHNLAYQGVFDRATFDRLGLPETLWGSHGVEYWGNLSFIKGGLAYADWITTVSPTYAKEIRTPEFGYGLEGLLSHRSDNLVGILNGVDYQVWDPRHDPHIPQHYFIKSFRFKDHNKRALQERFGLPQRPDAPLFGLVGRLVEQKGIDLVAEVLPRLLAAYPAQVVLVGTGEKWAEGRLRELREQYPDRIGLFIGYDEGMAHLVEAGADIFLMPSRFEPCGLNQIYSLRYGTVPIVRHTGGLADTVIDYTPHTDHNRQANGFVFDEASPQALFSAIERAMEIYPKPIHWRRLACRGMELDFSWEISAQQYLRVYQRARKVVLTGG